MHQFTRDGLTFDVIDSGPADSAPENTVILLHGFPQTPFAWSEVAPALNAAGVRTLAPTLRGYADGARPREIATYRIEELVDDVVALQDAAGLEACHIVGHDWGGSVAWAMAITHPERVTTLTAISTPHPAALRWASLHSSQGLKSWYMLAMQIPLLPEALFRSGLRREGMRRLGLPAAHDAAYTEHFLKRGAARSMINMYRAMRKRPRAGSQSFPTDLVTLPTTFVWGNADAYLGRAAAEKTAEYCRGEYRFREVDGDHWLPEKHPVIVAEEIIRRVRG